MSLTVTNQSTFPIQRIYDISRYINSDEFILGLKDVSINYYSMSLTQWLVITLKHHYISSSITRAINLNPLLESMPAS